MTQDDAEETFCEELAAYLPEYKTWLEDRLREKAEREERERLEKERLEKERQERERLERERQEKERLERERQQRERQLRIQQQEQERLRLEQERLSQQQMPRVESATRSLSLNDAALAGQAAAPPTPTAPVKSPSRSTIDPAEFRNGLRGSGENELTVGRGEIVTVRVPKPDGGACTRLMWQFSTADYDIGFGLDFEKREADGTTVLQPILPIMRVQSHATVAEGRHECTWDGAWLLKFDNSYSMVRSKTVYYRVLFLNI